MRITVLTDYYLTEGYTLGQAIAFAVQDVTGTPLHDDDLIAIESALD